MFDILNKTKQQQKVETRYWSIVSLKHLLSAAENLNRMKCIRLGLVLVILSGAHLKKGFIFYILLSSEFMFIQKTQTPSLVSSVPISYMRFILSESFILSTF